MRDDDFNIVRSNERAKLFSGIAANLATGLIAATAYRVFIDEKADMAAVLWLVIFCGLIWAAYAVLTLLEPES